MDYKLMVHLDMHDGSSQYETHYVFGIEDDYELEIASKETCQQILDEDPSVQNAEVWEVIPN